MQCRQKVNAVSTKIKCSVDMFMISKFVGIESKWQLSLGPMFMLKGWDVYSVPSSQVRNMFTQAHWGKTHKPEGSFIIIIAQHSIHKILWPQNTLRNYTNTESPQRLTNFRICVPSTRSRRPAFQVICVFYMFWSGLKEIRQQLNFLLLLSNPTHSLIKIILVW